MPKKICLFLMMALIAVPCFAQDGTDDAQTVEIAISKPADRTKPMAGKDLPLYLDEELAARHKEFRSFARLKIGALNRNHRFSRSRMLIEQQADGSWKARYHQIEQATMTCQVRRSKSKSVPYVGVLSYKESIYESTGASPAECKKGTFEAVRVIPNKHIFCYKKGGWK
ncbi:hypothetical protein [Salidesulfovibrio onnuriiensis]|uniref:hypothetical protein n=1 Tax=Salidesulfovibrio onnuriiensis TaxID=2583823 RepID=UPI0011C9C6B1|nr:hypothetical protein [Salidesulfovibrio onnuriiensis]